MSIIDPRKYVSILSTVGVPEDGAGAVVSPVYNPLRPLDLSNKTLGVLDPPGTLVGTVLNVTPGASVVLSDSHGENVTLTGIYNVVVGSNPPALAGQFDITLDQYLNDWFLRTVLQLTVNPSGGALKFNVTRNSALIGAL